MAELTNYPDGLASFSFPVLPGGLPIGQDSKYYFIDPTFPAGGDGTLKSPFSTLEAAYAKVRSGYWDGVFVIGTTTAVALAAAFTWSKNDSFLIGLCAPTLGQQRARITNGVSTNLFTPLVTISGSRVIVKNIQFFNGGNHATSAAVCLQLTGERCYFENCQISGGGTVASAGNAAMRSLVIAGGANQYGEHNFVHCQIGLDTILRNAVNYEIEITGHSPRNVFSGCLIDHNGVAGSFFLLVGAGGIDRYLLFNGCTFYNYTGNGGAALTNAYSINAAAGGDILMPRCMFVGATALPASALVWADPEAAANVILKALNPT